MPTCFLPFTARLKCGCEIDPQRRLGADEGRIESAKGLRQDSYRLRVADTSESVTAPPGQVHSVERHIRAFVCLVDTG